MDDNEARYLIDQYNKYASWGVRFFEILFPYFAVAVAIAALYFSSVSFRVSWMRAFVLAIGALACLMATTYLTITRHLKHREQLILLEDHRFKYKRLPDSVTFKKIVRSKFKPKDLEKLLKESEPSEQREASARGSEGVSTGFWNRKGVARAFFGLIFILAGFIEASFIPVFNMQTNPVAFTIFIGFAISLFTSGMVLVVEGALEYWSV